MKEKNEKGIILILLALMIVVLLGVIALAIDLSRVYSFKRQSSEFADFLSLSLLGEYLSEGAANPNSPINVRLNSALERAKVLAQNQRFIAAPGSWDTVSIHYKSGVPNISPVAALIEPGRWHAVRSGEVPRINPECSPRGSMTPCFEAVEENEDFHALRVSISPISSTKLFFGHLLGLTEIPIVADPSIAVMRPRHLQFLLDASASTTSVNFKQQGVALGKRAYDSGNTNDDLWWARRILGLDRGFEALCSNLRIPPINCQSILEGLQNTFPYSALCKKDALLDPVLFPENGELPPAVQDVVEEMRADRVYRGVLRRIFFAERRNYSEYNNFNQVPEIFRIMRGTKAEFAFPALGPERVITDRGYSETFDSLWENRKNANIFGASVPTNVLKPDEGFNYHRGNVARALARLLQHTYRTPLAINNIHFKDDYAFYYVRSFFRNGSDDGRQFMLYKDISRPLRETLRPPGEENLWPAKQDIVPTGQPLMSILDGMNQAVQAIRARALTGDLAGLMVFSDFAPLSRTAAERNPKAHYFSQQQLRFRPRYVALGGAEPLPGRAGSTFELLENITSYNRQDGFVTSTSGGDTFYNYFLFPDPRDNSDINGALLEALDELIHTEPRDAEKIVVLFTDGMANCYRPNYRAPYDASFNYTIDIRSIPNCNDPRPGRVIQNNVGDPILCDPSYCFFLAAMEELGQIRERYIDNNIRINVVLFGQSGPNTLLWNSNANTRSNYPVVDRNCMSIAEGQQSGLRNMVFDRCPPGNTFADCERLFYLSTVLGTEDFFPPNRNFYDLALETGGEFLPVRATLATPPRNEQPGFDVRKPAAISLDDFYIKQRQFLRLASGPPILFPGTNFHFSDSVHVDDMLTNFCDREADEYNNNPSNFDANRVLTMAPENLSEQQQIAGVMGRVMEQVPFILVRPLR